MARLIDADAFREFLEVIRQDYREEDTLSSGFAACLIETVQDEYLALAPTVDAVEVVRCKDCKHCYKSSGSSTGYRCKAWGVYDTDCEVTREHYCSYGERKDND